MEEEDIITLQKHDIQIIDWQLALRSVQTGFFGNIIEADMFKEFDKYFSDDIKNKLFDKKELVKYENAKKYVMMVDFAKNYLLGVDKKIIDSDDFSNPKFCTFIQYSIQSLKYSFDFKYTLCKFIKNSNMEDWGISNESRNEARFSQPRLDKDMLKYMQKKDAEDEKDDE